MTTLKNQYWPIYKRLEKSVDDLTHSIHICDDQLGVYSSQISDLILRIGAEIEAIAKAIYRREFDANMDDHSKFDEVAIKKFVQEWKLDQKVTFLSHPNCFCTMRECKPFIKDTTRTGKKSKTFLWNNAYQNLKHNREKSFSHANVRALLSAMSALFMLNLYYRDESLELEDDHSAVRIDPGLGSELFSVQFSSAAHWDGNHQRQPKDDFSESVYFVDTEPEYAAKFKESVDKFNEAYNNEILKSADAQEAIRDFDAEKVKNPNWFRESISSDTYIACAKRAQQIAPIPKIKPKYQAHVNRHQVRDEPKKG